MRPQLSPLALLLVLTAVAAVALPESVCAATPPLSAKAANDPALMLLERAQWWEARDRLDLAQEALDKLFDIDPKNPAGLAVQAQLEIKRKQPKEAQATLAELRRVQPDHPAIRRIEALLRTGGEDKDELRHARALVKEAAMLREQGGRLWTQGKEAESNARRKQAATRSEQAADIFRKLYPDGPPSGDLTLEYWQIVAETPNGRERAREGIARLVSINPNNLRYRLALAKHETSRLPLKQQALQIIIDMSKLSAYSKQARHAWHSAMLLLDDTPSSLPLLRNYLEAEPDDSAVREKQNLIVRAQERERKLLTDPDYRAKLDGLALLQKGEVDAAEPLLQQALRARPKDGELVGGMGMLRLRQGRHAEAREHFAAAARLDGAADNKWGGLVKVAQFWQLMREARDARQSGDFAQAETSLNAALQLQANDPDALVALAEVQVERKQFAAAEINYWRALAADAANSDALEGLVLLYHRQGKAREAQQTIALMPPKKRDALGAKLNRTEVAALQEEADLLRAEGREDEAIARLEHAIQLDASDPWLRYTLAKLYARHNRPEQGQELFDDLLAKHPDNAEALYALALYQSGIGKNELAFATLTRIPPSQRTAKTSRLWGRNIEQMAAAQVQAGHQDEAEKLLREAEKLAANDEEASLAIAIAWGKMREYLQADRLFDKLHNTPPSRRWRMRHAEYLAIQESSKTGEELATLAAMPAGSDDDEQELHVMQESHALRSANAQIGGGNPEAAHRTLAPFLQKSPEPIPLLLAEARAFRAEKQWPQAESVYTRILRTKADDEDARLGLIETEVAADARPAGLAQVDAWAADSQASADSRLQLADLYLLLNEPQRAHQQLDLVLAQHPRNARAHDKAWQLAQREEHPDAMIVHLQKALAADDAAATDDPDAYQHIGFDELGSPKKIHLNWKEKKLVALLDRRTAWLSAAVDMRSRSGTTGVSQYNSTEIPVEYKTPWHANDEVFFRTDVVRVSAGTVDATNTNLGSMLRCQPNCTAAPLEQTAQGMSFTAGYKGAFSADIGVTPLGFAVTNVVGGIRFGGDLGPLSVSLEASRRPVTASLLSFAGTVDPNTGRTWGGVVATGARLGLSLDKGETFGFWASLGQHALTGTNVLSNDRTQLMAGGQWRIINEENRLLSLGLTGMYWHHSQNAGEYSFGHGGYYSPQYYRSLAVPIAFGERYPRFSYVLRASVSASQSQTQTADYYPTDAALQAQAVALAPSSYVTPTYSGGSGSGTGYSGMAAWEYQATRKLFFGGLFSVERSDYYAPNRVLFYLRYSLDRPAAQPVYFQPLPVEPSSQF